MLRGRKPHSSIFQTVGANIIHPWVQLQEHCVPSAHNKCLQSPERNEWKAVRHMQNVKSQNMCRTAFRRKLSGNKVRISNVQVLALLMGISAICTMCHRLFYLSVSAKNLMNHTCCVPYSWTAPLHLFYFYFFAPRLTFSTHNGTCFQQLLPNMKCSLFLKEHVAINWTSFLLLFFCPKCTPCSPLHSALSEAVTHQVHFVCFCLCVFHLIYSCIL